MRSPHTSARLVEMTYLVVIISVIVMLSRPGWIRHLIQSCAFSSFYALLEEDASSLYEIPSVGLLRRNKFGMTVCLISTFSTLTLNSKLNFRLNDLTTPQIDYKGNADYTDEADSRRFF